MHLLQNFFLKKIIKRHSASPALLRLSAGLVSSMFVIASAQEFPPRPQQLLKQAESASSSSEKINLLETALRLAPNYLDARLELARALMQERQHPHAIAQLDTALNYKRDAAATWSLKGQAHFEMQDHQTALKCFERALKFGGESPEIYLEQGKAQHALQAWPPALSSFERAVALAGAKNQSRLEAEAWCWKGRVLQAQGENAGAAQAYRRALRLRPDLAEAAARLNALERAVQLEEWYQSAETARQVAAWQEAENFYNRIYAVDVRFKDVAARLQELQSKRQAQTLLATAQQRHREQRFEEAERLLLQALRLDSSLQTTISSLQRAWVSERASVLQKAAPGSLALQSLKPAPPETTKALRRSSSPGMDQSLTSSREVSNGDGHFFSTLPMAWIAAGGTTFVALLFAVFFLQKYFHRTQLEKRAATAFPQAAPAAGPFAPPPVSPIPGAPKMEDLLLQLKRYRLEKELGRGGMGLVYKAYDLKLERYVALKLIRLDNVLDGQEAAERVSRFRREAKATARLNHPNIVSLHDFDEIEGALYMTMEYVPGKSVEQLLAQERPRAVAEVIEVLQQACAALDYAHQTGVVHRDLKPSNIMRNEPGVVKLVDFGVAKMLGTVKTQLHTLTGMRLGSPFYMSPEQIEAQALDGRTDIYSLGAVCYEMLTGLRPFRAQEGESLSSLFHAILHVEPIKLSKLRCDLPAELESMIEKMLAKDRAQRYQQAQEISAALRHLK